MEEEQNLPWGMIIRRMNSEVFRILKKRIREQAEILLTIDESSLKRYEQNWQFIIVHNQ